MKLPQKYMKPARYNIKKQIRRLRRNSPVRLWIESHAEKADGSAWALFDTLARTEPDGWVDRAVAFHFLGLIELSPVEREHAARLLLDAFKKPDVGILSLGRFGRTYFMAFLGWLMFTVIFFLPTLGDLPGILLTSIVTTSLLLGIQERNRTLLTRCVTATALAPVGGPECIVALWERVRRTSPIFDELIAALEAILPRVTADWYGQLPAGCNDALVDIARSDITRSTFDYLALPALDALERAGDGSCAKAVARITKRSLTPAVSQRAAAVLPTLIARREREQASATLLRPIDSASTEHLVRPVSGAVPDVTNLLRASLDESQNALGSDVNN